MTATRRPGPAAIAAVLLLAGSAWAIDAPLFGGPEQHPWKQAPTATDPELRAVGFEPAIVKRLDDRTSASAGLLRGRSGSAAPPIGLSWPVGSAVAYEIVTAERPALAAEGYVLFLAERNFGTEPDRIGLVRSTDPLAPVVQQGTVGAALGIGNGEIVKRLREWSERVPYDLIGAGRDWVELELREVPPALASFAEEIRELAPDSVGRTPEALGSLQEEIRRSRRVFLWWD